MDIETLKSLDRDRWSSIAIPKSFIISSGESYLDQIKLYSFIYINSFKEAAFPIWEGTVSDIVTSLGYQSIKNCGALTKNIALSIEELVELGYIDVINKDHLPSGEFISSIKPRSSLSLVISRSVSDIANNYEYVPLSGWELFRILNYTKLKPAPVGDENDGEDGARGTRGARGTGLKVLSLLTLYLIIKERIWRYAGRYAHIRRDELATASSMSRNTTNTAIRILRDIGLIDYRKIGGIKKNDDSFFNQSSIYIITSDNDDDNLDRLNHAIEHCYNRRDSRDGYEGYSNEKNDITPYYVKNDDGLILDPMIGCE